MSARYSPSVLVLLAAPIFLASCLDSNGPQQVDYFEATVSGDLSLLIAGNAYFGKFSDPETAKAGFIVQMASFSAMPTRGITLVGHLAGIPRADEYPVLLVTEEDADGNPFADLPEDHFIAVYTHRQIQPRPEFFYSKEGTISFDEVSEEYIEATFSFSASGRTEMAGLDTVNVDIDGVFFARVAEITVQ